MTTETIESPNKSDVNNTDMVHIVVKGNPYKAICGARLQGILRPGASLDCLVCHEILYG
jgi:hypothetical protein